MTIMEIEAVELTDIEFERACCPFNHDCDRPAHVLLVWRCCGMEIPLCEPHFKEGNDATTANLERDGCTICATCVTMHMGRIGYDVVPL